MREKAFEWKDYPEEVAMDMSATLIKDNQEEYQHDNASRPPNIHEKFWQMTTFYFVSDHGLAKIQKLTHTKRMEKDGGKDGNIAFNRATLEDLPC